MPKEAIIPFPQIPPGFFPGEDRPVGVYVTEEFSTLRDPVVLAIADAVSSYRMATTRDQRDRAIEKAKGICEVDYPNQYGLLRQYIADSAARVAILGSGDPSLRSYDLLDQVVAKGYEPPTNARIHFLFENHAVYNQAQKEETKNRMRNTLAGFFTKDGRNIYFYEDSAQDKRKTEAFRNGVRSGGSFLNAAYYYDLYVALGRREPTAIQMASVQEVAQRLAFVNQHFEYRKAVCEVLDEFAAEKYKIEVIMEGAKNIGGRYFPSPNRDPRSMGELRHRIARQADSDAARDESSVKQLDQIVEDAPTDIQTNILMDVGSAHETMTLLLPKRLLAVSTVESYPESRRLRSDLVAFDTKYHEIYMKVKRGLPVDDSEYDQLFSLLQDSWRVASRQRGNLLDLII